MELTTRNPCGHCGKTLAADKRPHAVYCNRSCKNGASEIRRNVDNRARYLKERERRLAYAKAYQKANPEVPQRAKRKRKALLTGNGVYRVSAKDWRRELQRWDHKCAYCRREARLTMDHVIPASRGGTHSIGNLVPACKSCNSSKRDRTVMEWRLKLPSPRQRGGNRADRRIPTPASAAPHDWANLAEEAGRLLVVT